MQIAPASKTEAEGGRLIIILNTAQAMYSFEPFGGADEKNPADSQYNQLIADETAVVAGIALGPLLYYGDGAHVRFGFTNNNTWVCPMPFFTAVASEKILETHR